MEFGWACEDVVQVSGRFLVEAHAGVGGSRAVEDGDGPVGRMVLHGRAEHRWWSGPFDSKEEGGVAFEEGVEEIHVGFSAAAERGEAFVVAFELVSHAAQLCKGEIGIADEAQIRA